MARLMFALRVCAEPSVDAIRSLRAWLKRGLRDYGLRCTDIQQVDEKENTTMAINLNDADDQKPGTMPPGPYWVKARIKPGGWGDDGLLRLARNQYSLMLEVECVVIDDEEWRGKKIIDYITCELAEYDHSDPLSLPPAPDMGTLSNLQTSVRIGRSKLKAMINSAFNLQPRDDSDEAKARRTIDSYKAIDGLAYMVQAEIQAASGKYREKNVIDFVIEPDDPAYRPRGSNSKQLVTKPKPPSGGGGGPVPFDDDIPFAPNFL